jgi:hypothetical protein
MPQNGARAPSKDHAGSLIGSLHDEDVCPTAPTSESRRSRLTGWNVERERRQRNSDHGPRVARQATDLEGLRGSDTTLSTHVPACFKTAKSKRDRENISTPQACTIIKMLDRSKTVDSKDGEMSEWLSASAATPLRRDISP